MALKQPALTDSVIEAADALLGLDTDRKDCTSQDDANASDERFPAGCVVTDDKSHHAKSPESGVLRGIAFPGSKAVHETPDWRAFPTPSLPLRDVDKIGCGTTKRLCYPHCQSHAGSEFCDTKVRELVRSAM